MRGCGCVCVRIPPPFTSLCVVLSGCAVVWPMCAVVWPVWQCVWVCGRVRVGVREGGVAAVCVGVQEDGVAERVWRVRARTVVAADVLGSGRDGRLCAYV
eukprot:COSAG01_NODE_49145_length_374_cov_3.636364_1_plen_99_part_01